MLYPARWKKITVDQSKSWKINCIDCSVFGGPPSINSACTCILYKWELKKKRKPGLIPNFSKSKRDITQLISVHYSILSILLSFGIIVHSYLAMDGCTTINLVKHVKTVLSKLALFALHDGICASFYSKAAKQNLDKKRFDMLYKNYCWAAIPNPIWMTNVPFESKIIMLSSTDKNFMILLFNFESFRIESWFRFVFTRSVYVAILEACICELSQKLLLFFVRYVIP